MCRRAERGGRRRYADRSGFTLIEALVAFTVMATVLGVLYRGVVQTRAGATAFASRTQEEIITRSLIAEFGARRDLRDGSYAGTRDGRRWTLKASAVDLSAQLPQGDKALGADTAPSDPAKAGAPAKLEPTKPGSAKPVWVAQRLVLRVATGGRPLESETVHLVKPAPPPDEDAR